jgi:FemAB-related protein (PEP-CTERM system-associated)
MIQIHLDREQVEWDAYVTGSRSAVFSHLHGWGEVLASTYDLRILRLVARDSGVDGRMVGGVPLILFSPPGSERRLISLPYTDAAGILADDEDIAGRLLSAALGLAADLDAAHLELRQEGKPAFPSRMPESGVGVHHIPYSFKAGMSRVLPGSSEALWTELDAKVRNQVRKARKCGLRAEIGGSELLADFFSVFSENMRDLGSPVHAAELFQRLVERLSAQVFVIYSGLTPAAAALVFRLNSTLFNPWASSLRGFRPFCPNMLLYWTMLAFGADNGCSSFDFGRSSPGAPTCRFKLQWGALMQPLVWHVFSRRPPYWDPRDESLTDDAWKRMELDASRRQGPSRRRWISL